jgi:hypothetical protein
MNFKEYLTESHIQNWYLPLEDTLEKTLRAGTKELYRLYPANPTLLRNKPDPYHNNANYVYKFKSKVNVLDENNPQDKIRLKNYDKKTQEILGFDIGINIIGAMRNHVYANLLSKDRYFGVITTNFGNKVLLVNKDAIYDNYKSFELVRDYAQYNENPQELPDKVKKELYVYSRSNTPISDDSVRWLTMNYNPPYDSVTAYRLIKLGISELYHHIIKKNNLRKLFKGDFIDIHWSKPSGWSKDPKMSRTFSNFTSFNLLFKYEIKKAQVLFDFSDLESKFAFEKEILLRPGTFKVKLADIVIPDEAETNDYFYENGKVELQAIKRKGILVKRK